MTDTFSSGLYNPTMVRVTVENKQSNYIFGNGRETFGVPRELLCARSSYFKALFHNGLREAHTGRVTLPDVSPRVFRVFVGWLYSQSIYYDGSRDEPVYFSQQNDPGLASANQDQQQSSSRANANDESRNHDFATDSVGGTDETAPATFTVHDSYGLQHELLRSALRSQESSKKRTSRGKPSNQSTKTKPQSVIDLATIDSIAGGADTDRCNNQDPVTWAWIWLIELYIFADKYFIRDFRMMIFEVIQIKAFQKQPREYFLPSTLEVGTRSTN